MDKYDISRWKPLSSEAFSNELAMICVIDEDLGELKGVIENLPDGRIRIVFTAEVVEKAGEAPLDDTYLMMIYSPEQNKTNHFVRSDVRLAVP